MERHHKLDLGFVIAIILAGLVLQQVWSVWRETETVPYSEFRTLLKQQKFSDISVGGQVIRGTLKEPQSDGRKVLMAVRVPDDIAKELDESGTPYSGLPEATWGSTLLSWLLPGMLLFWLWRAMLSRMGGRGGGLGGLMSIGQSKAKVFVEKDIKVGFDDVAGVNEAKDELREIVAFLKDPARYGRLGAHAPKGILLAGPPGTGKTLLARAVAGEAGVPFFSINGSEFVEMFVGVGAARVRDLFEQARASAPCIIFIDELDALGRARALVGIAGANDEKEQTLNQLLSELDGFDPSAGVVLLAATNRPEILDPALLRAGRFDRHIVVDRPDKRGREDILTVHLRRVKVAENLDVTEVAGLTPGFTGADLANLVNEAATLATRRGGSAVTADDFVQAVERIIAGPEKRNRVISPAERRIVAYHEMGHALVAMKLPGTEEVKKITILPRTVGALGYTLQMPIEDRYLMRRSELEAKMATLMGGRAAEALVFGDVSTGASDDLQKATEIARAIVTQFGMEPSLGQAVFGAPPNRFLPPQPGSEGPVSEATAARRDAAIIRLVGEADEHARSILDGNRPFLDRWAATLLEHETLGEAEIAQMKRELTAPAQDAGRNPGRRPSASLGE